jgi:uncharacterized protein (DUF58 family)
MPEDATRELSPQALLQRLEWTVLKRLDGALQGDYRTLFRGHGVDLADLREYQFHDDVRHIDWNVTARLTIPHVRQFTEERDLTAWFLLDLSPSIDFGSQRRKRELSEQFVAVMASLVLRHGNRAGAVLYANALDTVLPAKSGRKHVLHLMQRMRARPTAAAQGVTRLADLIERARPSIKRRCNVFVVSDFISEEGWEAPLARLAQRHDVVAVRLFDPMEMALPDVGLVTIEDAETGEQVFVDAADPAFRERYEAIAQEQEAALIESLSRSGADMLELATDDDLLDALMRFADLRRHRARLKTPRRFPPTMQRARPATAAPGAGAPAGASA